MESETHELGAGINVSSSCRQYPSSLALYEEYSGTPIDSTVMVRRERFEAAGLEARRELSVEVEGEADDFCQWLIRTKGFDTLNAHFHAASLKSLLLGLPFGVRFAELLGIILDGHVER